MLLRLGDPPGPDTAPKLAVLSRLHAAGLPVPDGLGLSPDALAEPAARRELADLLARGPVIVRAALAREDTADASAAGLGLSIPDCRDLSDLDRAAARIAAACADPWLVRYSGGAPPAHQLLVQRQIARRWLAVLAADRDDLPGACLELHDAADFDALAAGATPASSGPLARAEPALRAPLTGLLRHVASVLSATPALDLEVIVAPDGACWLVQARPLVRPLVAGWPAFLAEVAPGAARIPDLPGLWRLDAEHNPAALSPAHAGAIAWLAERGAPLRVLAGWLYEHVPETTSAAPRPTAHAALAALQTRHLPAARRALAEFDAVLAAPDLAPPRLAAPPHAPAAAVPATASPSLSAHRATALASSDHAPHLAPPDLAPLVDRALEHLQGTLAVYAELRAAPPAELAGATDPSAPLCLRGRAAHLDVLPAAWDLASPVLADMLATPGPIEPAPADIPTDPARAFLLLRELDDHLFALGLAPLRRVYLAAGAHLGLDAFLLTPPELRRVLEGDPIPDLEARRAAKRRRSALTPPLALLDGRPIPLPPRGRLRGLPTGPSRRGPIARRRDLADLLARPPGPEDIVVLPALTAQAAVVLQALAVRAVCCEHGGALSHAALMVRELGLSALVGCRGCCELPDGAFAELDTRLGRLRLLDPPAPSDLSQEPGSSRPRPP